MSLGSIMQIKHFGGLHSSRKLRKTLKKQMIRRERRRAKANVECLPRYKKYTGWEY